MASSRKYVKLIFSVIFAVVALYPMPEVTGVSYPLNHQGLLPPGKNLGNPLSSSPSIPKQKRQRKKTLKVSKNLYQKLVASQAEMEQEADRDAAETVFPIAHAVNQQKQKQIQNPNDFFSTPRKFPESVMKSNLKPDQLEEGKTNKNFTPYYDCPLLESLNNIDGKAIIKPDPFDCGCCYYCNWGIHYVQCCSWPLLWNDDIKSCDWYWKVHCYTSDFWKK